MYETWHIIGSYIVGTLAGVFVFKSWVREGIITMTIESLADQGYLYATELPDGTVSLTRVDDVIEDMIRQVEDLSEGENAKDDTP